MALDATNYTPDLDQSASHNGFERYSFLPVNNGVDTFRYEYQRDFSGVPTATDERAQFLIRALLTGGVLNDPGFQAALISIGDDVSVTDIDTFNSLFITRLAS